MTLKTGFLYKYAHARTRAYRAKNGNMPGHLASLVLMI